MSAEFGLDFDRARTDHEWWGGLSNRRSALDLANAALAVNVSSPTGADRNREVDFVVEPDAISPRLR